MVIYAQSEANGKIGKRDLVIAVCFGSNIVMLLRSTRLFLPLQRNESFSSFFWGFCIPLRIQRGSDISPSWTSFRNSCSCPLIAACAQSKKPARRLGLPLTFHAYRDLALVYHCNTLDLVRGLADPLVHQCFERDLKPRGYNLFVTKLQMVVAPRDRCNGADPVRPMACGTYLGRGLIQLSETGRKLGSNRLRQKRVSLILSNPYPDISNKP